jgi:WhiB family redox-sensing transcriptional regulator
MAWMKDRNCDGVNPNIFFPSRGDSIDPAVRICSNCPVAGPCLNYALANNLPGVWGGTSERERRRIKRRAKVAKAEAAKH